MPSMYLCPDDGCWIPSRPDALVDPLRALGLLGSRWPGESDTYTAGKQFLHLVMFLGCAPHVVLDPEDPEPAQPPCAVTFIAFDAPVLFTSTAQAMARCPECRASLSLPATLAPDAIHRCERCQTEMAIRSLDWRNSAGCGRFFLELSGIYPHEAVPSDKLLSQLEALACCKWSYFYADKPSSRTF